MLSFAAEHREILTRHNAHDDDNADGLRDEEIDGVITFSPHGNCPPEYIPRLGLGDRQGPTW
jgi:hypothetical protein